MDTSTADQQKRYSLMQVGVSAVIGLIALGAALVSRDSQLLFWVMVILVVVSLVEVVWHGWKYLQLRRESA
ncbi:hypothetical protein FB554_3383 [Barrientosiimonas humi]|uniref:Uncharacterized protein n=1 Tax=Barrientosiimonas humi TaxID=999931 RepID=A0A542WZQ6_9MICO|nr:hypothetical protein [Barrientosiimonas humi]TQL29066.1 hypothetical protein FB554_3383 [Barrientosiimonas humi]CAG7571594.1 hypothetical protein BH39T_PBIAJDOK_00450 [Barrientosiimonas humi]